MPQAVKEKMVDLVIVKKFTPWISRSLIFEIEAKRMPDILRLLHLIHRMDRSLHWHFESKPEPELLPNKGQVN